MKRRSVSFELDEELPGDRPDGGAIAFDAAGEHLAAGLVSTVVVCELRSGELVEEHAIELGEMGDLAAELEVTLLELALPAGGKSLVARLEMMVDNNGDVHGWTQATRRPSGKLMFSRIDEGEDDTWGVDDGGCRGLAVSPDARVLAEVGSPLRLSELARGRVLATPPIDAYDAAFGPAPGLLVVTEYEAVSVVELPSGQVRHRMPLKTGGERAPTWLAADGATVLRATVAGLTTLRPRRKPAVIAAPDGETLTPLRIAADGRSAFFRGARGRIVHLAIADGEWSPVDIKLPRAATNVTVSADGSWIAWRSGAAIHARSLA